VCIEKICRKRKIKMRVTEYISSLTFNGFAGFGWILWLLEVTLLVMFMVMSWLASIALTWMTKCIYTSKL
jgi:hypothetical protein